MATQGRRPARRPHKPTPKRGTPQKGAAKGAAPKRSPKGAAKNGQAPVSTSKRAASQQTEAPMAADEPRTFRLGAVEGATPGTWIDRWKQRMPHVPLELVRIEIGAQRAALDDLDAALVRLPLALPAAARDDDLHIIALYDEVPVVVASVDSHLLAADELALADLAGEVVLRLSDDPLAGFAVPDTVPPRFAALAVADAVATVAAGTGAVIVPMSLARLHHRKDVDWRPLVDGPTSTVALAWRRERTTPDVETFVGIVRGRTAHSSR